MRARGKYGGEQGGLIEEVVHPPPANNPVSILMYHIDSSNGVDDQPVEYYLLFFLWILSAIVSTCYTFTWDIKMDWGLFQGKYKLREELIYSKKVSLLSLPPLSLLHTFSIIHFLISSPFRPITPSLLSPCLP